MSILEIITFVAIICAIIAILVKKNQWAPFFIALSLLALAGESLVRNNVTMAILLIAALCVGVYRVRANKPKNRHASFSVNILYSI